MAIWIVALLVIPWLATLGGSLLALWLPLGSARRQGWLLGFAAGVMVAASIWSLILPAFEEAGTELAGLGIVTGGFILGCLGMLALDHILPHQHQDSELPEGHPSHMSRPMLLVMAVALHNIPEGMALGVVMGAMVQETAVGIGGALAFGLGLALQNFPEGMAVVLPMRQTKMKHKRIAFWGVLASFAEPASALIGWAGTVILTSLGGVFMPLLLSIAAGAMVFIVVEELIPESQAMCAEAHSHTPTYGFLIGFWAMVLLGVGLG